MFKFLKFRNVLDLLLLEILWNLGNLTNTIVIKLWSGGEIRIKCLKFNQKARFRLMGSNFQKYADPYVSSLDLTFKFELGVLKD